MKWRITLIAVLIFFMGFAVILLFYGPADRILLEEKVKVTVTPELTLLAAELRGIID